MCRWWLIRRVEWRSMIRTISAANGWIQVGGTSLSAPLWAGLIAVADQGRSLAGLGSLDGRTQTLPLLYQLPANDFHDITSGSNGFSAGAGYDLVTGRGSPKANLVVAGLLGSEHFGNGFQRCERRRRARQRREWASRCDRVRRSE